MRKRKKTQSHNNTKVSDPNKGYVEGLGITF